MARRPYTLKCATYTQYRLWSNQKSLINSLRPVNEDMLHVLDFANKIVPALEEAGVTHKTTPKDLCFYLFNL